MSEQNKQLVRTQIDAVNEGKLVQFLEAVSEDVVDHFQFPGQPAGREGIRWRLNMFRTAFPDFQLTIERQVAEGDLVANWYTARGTNTGEIMGMPATGKAIEITASDIVRIRDGKVVEHWGLPDMMTMMQQLGMTPGPEGA